MVYFLRCVGMASMHRTPKDGHGASGSGDAHYQEKPTGPSPTRATGGKHLRKDDAGRRHHTTTWIRKTLRPDSVPTLNYPLDTDFVRVTFKATDSFSVISPD